MASRVGALTTTFTPEPSCLSSLTDIYIIESGTRTWNILGPVETSDCFPPNFDSTRGAYYSPGVCPEGYTTATQTTNVDGDVTETVATCCPSSMSAFRREAEFPFEETLGCSKDFAEESSTFVATHWDDGSLGDTTTSTASTGGLNAYSVQIRYRDTDFQTTSTEASTATSIVVDTVSSRTTLSAASETGDSSPESSSSAPLSSGAVAGIAIGSAAAVLIFAAVLWMVYRRGQAKGRATTTTTTTTGYAPREQLGGGWVPFGGDKFSTVQQVAELPASTQAARHELATWEHRNVH